MTLEELISKNKYQEWTAVKNTVPGNQEWRLERYNLGIGCICEPDGYVNSRGAGPKGTFSYFYYSDSDLGSQKEPIIGFHTDELLRKMDEIARDLERNKK